MKKKYWIFITFILTETWVLLFLFAYSYNCEPYGDSADTGNFGQIRQKVFLSSEYYEEIMVATNDLIGHYSGADEYSSRVSEAYIKRRNITSMLWMVTSVYGLVLGLVFWRKWKPYITRQTGQVELKSKSVK